MNCYVYSSLLYCCETWTLYTWMIWKGWLHSRCGSTDAWAVFHGQRREQINMSLIIWMLPSPWWKTFNSRKLKYFGHVKRHQNILEKCNLEGVIGEKKMLKTSGSAQCLVWQTKGVDRSVTACSAAAKNQGAFEAPCKNRAEWRSIVANLRTEDGT